MLSFGFIQEDLLDQDNLLDVSGPRRHQEANTEQEEEPQSVTQVAPPTALSLNDLLIPDGVGALEQITYNSKRKISGPAAVLPSYLFLDSVKPKNSLHYINPKYLVYNPFEFFATIPYLAVYGKWDFGHYSIEEQLVYVGQPKGNPPAIAQQVFPAYIWSPSYKQARAASKKYQAAAPAYARAETSSQVVHQASVQRLSISSSDIPAIPKPKALEAVVSRAEIIAAPIPIAQIYAARFAYQIQPLRTWAKPLPETGIRLKLDSIVKVYSIPKPQNREAESYQDKNPQSPNFDKSAARNVATVYQHHFVPYSFNHARNYDMQPSLIRILSSPNSRFWQTTNSYLGVYSGKQGTTSTKQLSEEDSESQDTKYKNSKYKAKQPDKDEDKIKPKYEEEKDITIDDKKDIDKKKRTEQKYNTDNKVEIQEQEVPEIKAVIEYTKNSGLTYAKSVAAIGAGAVLLGLIGFGTIVSLPFNKPENKYELQEPVSNPQKNQTIDSVVGPAAPAATGADREKFFVPQLKEDLTMIMDEAKQLGYGFSAMSIIKNSTGEYLGIGEDKKPKPAPSLNKVPIAFAVGYLAQQKLIDLDKLKIDFDPERDKDCILARELDRYQIFKEKGQIDYSYLRNIMIRESVNTAANIILKYLGNGNKEDGQTVVERVMAEIGLNDTKISHYLPDGEYLKGVTSTENAARLQSHMSQGRYLKPQYVNPITEDLENEAHLAIERGILQAEDRTRIKSRTKITFLKEGTGFTIQFGDYSGAVLFNDPKVPLWTDDRVNDATSIRRFEVKTMSDTRKLFGKIFGTLQKYLVEPTYTNRPS